MAFLIGNGAKIRPLEMGGKSPGFREALQSFCYQDKPYRLEAMVLDGHMISNYMAF